MNIDSEQLLQRFLRYVKIDTTSDPHSDSYPSTHKQKDLGILLEKELREMDIDAEIDHHGIVYGFIPSNVSHNVPSVCYCAHMDTSPDVSGTAVQPLVHRNYSGGVINLPRESIKISPEDHPDLKNCIGHDIITASGNTLLGADNKAGIAAIMQALVTLKKEKISHGELRILFTCDEEIGRGVDKVDLDKLKADVAYTIDGERAGTVENETFSADSAVVHINGISAHPGFAKGKLVNALKIAGDFLSALPPELSPEQTEKREGFIHPLHISGNAEKCEVEMILRNFETEKLQKYRQLLDQIASEVEGIHSGSSVDIAYKKQYRNMKETLDQHPEITEIAVEAVNRAGLKPELRSIRGGTDGSRLTEMGLPCPNIFAGEHAFHSRQEWVSLQDMQSSAATILHIIKLWTERTNQSS